MPSLRASSAIPQAGGFTAEELVTTTENPEPQNLRELALPGLVQAGYRLLLPLAKGGTSEASMPFASRL